MKKALAIIFAVAVVLSLSVTAFADGPSRNQSFGFSQQMPGNFQQGRGPAMGGQSPMMGGRAPDMNGRPPVINGQVPSGEAPSDLPECSEMNGEAPEFRSQAPDMNGRPPMMGGKFGEPTFIDFDTMIEDGVISQDTYDRIKAYMEENKPDDLPEMNGEAPEMDGQPPMMKRQGPDGETPVDLPEPPEFDGEAPEFESENPMINGLLNDLLEAGVITQAEYDALVAAIAK